MKTELYTINTETGAFIKVMATGHRQHIWNETILIGVSQAGTKKLDDFLREHNGERITVNAGPYNPRLVGYEKKEIKK